MYSSAATVLLTRKTVIKTKEKKREKGGSGCFFKEAILLKAFPVQKIRSKRNRQTNYSNQGLGFKIPS